MDALPIRELIGDEVRHCTTAFWGNGSTVITALETLPYHDLGASGLERLCYELLLSKGYEPRFFGRTGQAQYGIDIVVEENNAIEVFQCKNLRAAPTAATLNGYLTKFEHDWLAEADLPRPSRFVLCCPTPWRDSRAETQWAAIRATFEQRTNISLGLWDQDLLDAWLKKLPDIVAHGFSDQHAQAFCVTDWKTDLFKPLQGNATGDRRIGRYISLRSKNHFCLDQEREFQINTALSRSPVIVVRGAPGTGKTFMALHAAEEMRPIPRRTYFVDVGDQEFSKTHFRDGVRARLSRPSVFVLENCQDKEELVAEAIDDLAPSLASARTAIICLFRRVPTLLEDRRDDAELFLELESHGAAVDFEVDVQLVKRFVEFWRPDFVGLPRERLSKIMAVCGGDLYLLDELLGTLDSPSEIDQLSPTKMSTTVLRRYLGAASVEQFTAARRLAALAQFEIQPRADVLKLTDREIEVLESMCVRAGRPPRWHFLHTTAAELLLHALWYGMGVVDTKMVGQEACADAIDYLNSTQSSSLRPPADLSAIAADLLRS